MCHGVRLKTEDGKTDKKPFCTGFSSLYFGLSPPLPRDRPDEMSAPMTEMKKEIEWAGNEVNEWKDGEYISLEKYANIHLFAYHIYCINLYVYIA